MGIFKNGKFILDGDGNIQAAINAVSPTQQSSPYGTDANGNKTNTTGASGGQQGDAGVPAPAEPAAPAPAEPAAPAPAEPVTPAPAEPAAPAPAEPVTPAPVAAPSPWENGLAGGYDPTSNMTKAQAIAAYNKWATDNGKPAADIGEIYSFINGQDPNKSQKDIEAEEKKMKRNEDWERVGNFLAHLGNFVGTISGAPSQELEPAINLTKRQQALRDKTMALRQKSVSDYLSTYRQKQDEALKQQNLELKLQQLDAKIKEQTAKIEDLKAKREIEKFKADTDREFKNESLEIRHKALEIQQRLAERRINIAQANAETNALRASLQKEKQDRDKNGYTEEKTDARGRKTTTVRRPNSPNNNNGSSQGRDNKSGKIKTKTQL